MKRWQTTLAVGTVFLGGVALGNGIESDQEGETRTVTREVEVTSEPEVITKEVVKEVEVETVPQACLDALDSSEAVAGHVYTVLDITAQAIVAAATFDSDGMNRLTDQLNALQGPLGADVNNYTAAADACRSAA